MLAIYVRLSKEDENSNSIENQLREAKLYASDNEILNYKVYNEGEGKSGTLGQDKRPKFKELNEDIEAGKITHIWMRKQDRLARSGVIVINFIELVIKHKIKLFFGDRGLIDLSIPTEKFQIVLYAAIDELKPSEQSSSTIKSLRQNAEEGKTNGTIPYGYDTKNMFPYVVNKEKKIIHLIIDKYLKGDGTKAIAEYLNGKGIPTKSKNSIWKPQTIKNILKCRWYIGERTYSKVKYYNVPKIVDEVLFQKVQIAMENRKSRRFGDNKSYDYLLRGLIKCGRCGRNFTAKHRPNKYDNFYLCGSKSSKYTNCGNHTINIPKFDTFIIKYLFQSKDLLTQLENIKNSNNVTKQLKIDLADLQNEFETTERKVIKYAKLLGEDDDDIYIEKEYSNSKKQLKKIKASITNTKVQLADSTNSEALNRYKKVIKAVDLNSDFITLKEAVHNTIESITISANEFNIPEEFKQGLMKPFTHKIMYNIEIMYKGMSEVTNVSVTRPYTQWVVTTTINYDGINPPSVQKKPMKLITIHKDQIINFKKEPRIN